MRILSLLVLIVAAYFVAHGDQHASSATVIAADGRVWNNVRMDWTLAGDLQLRDPIGHRLLHSRKRRLLIRMKRIPGISAFSHGSPLP